MNNLAVIFLAMAVIINCLADLSRTMDIRDIQNRIQCLENNTFYGQNTIYVGDGYCYEAPHQ